LVHIRVSAPLLRALTLLLISFACLSEAGIELRGTEVKSIRAGTLNLKDSYCVVKNGELSFKADFSIP